MQNYFKKNVAPGCPTFNDKALACMIARAFQCRRFKQGKKDKENNGLQGKNKQGKRRKIKI